MTLKQRREAAMLRQQAIVNAAKMDGNRSLTEEEQTEFDSCQREIEQAENEMEAQKRGLSGGTGAGTAPSAANQQANAHRAMSQEEQRNMVEEERRRTTEIMELCREFQLEPAEYIKNGSSLEQVRSVVLDNMRQNNGPINVQVTRDEGETFRQRAADGRFFI